MSSKDQDGDYVNLNENDTDKFQEMFICARLREKVGLFTGNDMFAAVIIQN